MCAFSHTDEKRYRRVASKRSRAIFAREAVHLVDALVGQGRFRISIGDSERETPMAVGDLPTAIEIE